ncbi:DUF4148 domain-containing protein [Paraburkholderia sp. 1N]|uniref:DUF4148 domain-containing protein n=1 Tax=Paraburkholderia solitsugae TaxID=2675748 RepID=A0ABX2BKG5_9BURK|nr:DUF4148 domain-containing protein [Paraburkholderia solitsugae]NPT40258.1 DUF4148 domain-containing protein [Paraburkholderia solitsugae]
MFGFNRNLCSASPKYAASSSAFAQSRTRAEVYHELIEAQQSGLNYVTETSYPEVNPIYAAQVKRIKRDHSVQQSASIDDSTTH